MLTRTLTALALASLGLTSVACDVESSDEPTPMMAADVIDLDDAKALAAEDERAEPLVEAVELTADADADASMIQEIIDYCWGAGQAYQWQYAGQCIGWTPMLVDDFCIVADPYLASFGHAVQCSSY